VNAVGRLVLGAGVSGLVVWLSARGSNWLRDELTYQRWRRQRFHTIVLPNPEAVRAQRIAAGRALVWDGRMPQAQGRTTDAPVGAPAAAPSLTWVHRVWGSLRSPLRSSP
jgi:hypothetical protein